MTHVMLDLETWGTQPGFALRSIGACTFDPFDWSHNRLSFYHNIIDERPRDPETVSWWSKQSAGAQAVFANPWPVTLAVAMRDFTAWFQSVGGSFIWSHGSCFDIVMVEHALTGLWLKAPWKYSAISDTRTLLRAAGVSVTVKAPWVIKHHALHDAHNQAHAIELCHASLAVHRY